MSTIAQDARRSPAMLRRSTTVTVPDQVRGRLRPTARNSATAADPAALLVWSRPLFVQRLATYLPIAALLLLVVQVVALGGDAGDYALPLSSLFAIAVATLPMRRADKKAEEILKSFTASPSTRPYRRSTEQLVPIACAVLFAWLSHTFIWSAPYVLQWSGDRKLPWWAPAIWEGAPGPADLHSPLYLLDLLCIAAAGFLFGRVVLLAWRIAQVGRAGRLTVQAGHPDRSGGLHPLGSLTATCALVPIVPALWVGAWCWVLLPSALEYRNVESVVWTRSGTVVAFVTGADLAAFHPLWVFVGASLAVAVLMLWAALGSLHRAMRTERMRCAAPLAGLGQEIAVLREKLVGNAGRWDTARVEDGNRKLAGLEELYRQSRHVPVWPFNRTHVAKVAMIHLPALVSLAVTVQQLNNK